MVAILLSFTFIMSISPSVLKRHSLLLELYDADVQLPAFKHDLAQNKRDREKTVDCTFVTFLDCRTTKSFCLISPLTSNAKINTKHARCVTCMYILVNKKYQYFNKFGLDPRAFWWNIWKLIRFYLTISNPLRPIAFYYVVIKKLQFHQRCVIDRYKSNV
jgi:hypothetical protein